MSESVDKKVDKKDIKELLNKIRSDFITPYQDEEAANIREISSTTDLSKSGSNPTEELTKLSKLIKAHSTKVGIICHPDKVRNDSNIKAIFTELSNLTNSIFYLFSLLPLFYRNTNDSFAEFFLKALDKSIMSLLQGVSKLVDDLVILLDEIESKENDIEESNKSIDSENRLIAVGMIWTSCDNLIILAEKNSIGVLCDNIRSSCALADDILIDIEEWFEDPTLGTNMLLDIESEDEDEESNNRSDLEDNEDETEAIEKMKDFLEKWQVNVKLIKLLLSSFTKSISQKSTKNNSNYSGSALDALQKLHVGVIEILDELLTDVFMSDSSFEPTDMDESSEKLNVIIKEIVKIIRKINSSDPKNSKWIEVWEIKYFETNKCLNKSE